MQNNNLNNKKYNEADFLEMYHTYFKNLIDLDTTEKSVIKEDTKLYQFCIQCIERIEALIEYTLQKETRLDRLSDASFDIAIAYQTLLEYCEGENYDKMNTKEVTLSAYMRNKRTLLKRVPHDNNDHILELFQSLEARMPQGESEGQELYHRILLDNIQIVKHLVRLQELQQIENELFFTTYDESQQELSNNAVRCMKKLR